MQFLMRIDSHQLVSGTSSDENVELENIQQENPQEDVKA